MITLNDYILNRSSKLIKKYKTRDPFEIASGMNIDIIFVDLGELKGFYQRDGHNRFIVINERLEEPVKKIVCAHELGHDQLHRDFATSITMQEFGVYDMKNQPEYEANVFAADLLLSDEQIMTCFNQGYSFYETACILETDKHLLAIKLMAMNNAGYDFNIPLDLKSDFLGGDMTT